MSGVVVFGDAIEAPVSVVDPGRPQRLDSASILNNLSMIDSNSHCLLREVLASNPNVCFEVHAGSIISYIDGFSSEKSLDNFLQLLKDSMKFSSDMMSAVARCCSTSWAGTLAVLSAGKLRSQRSKVTRIPVVDPNATHCHITAYSAQPDLLPPQVMHFAIIRSKSCLQKFALHYHKNMDQER